MACGLPEELTSHIVAQFDEFQSILRFGATCKASCKTTYETIAHNSRLISLFVQKLFSSLKPQQLRIFLRRFSKDIYSTPYKIVVGNESVQPLPLIKMIKNRFPNVSDIKIDVEIRKGTFYELLEIEQLASLHFLRLKQIPAELFLEVSFPQKLRSLKLCNALITDDGLKLIFDRCKQLSSLSLINTTCITSGAFRGYTMQSLKKVVISGNRIDDAALAEILKSVPSCTSLKLCSCSRITGSFLLHWPHAKSLRKFSFSSLSADSKSLSIFFKRCRGLVQLDLSDCYALQPSFFSSAHFPRTLCDLQIAFCQINSEGIAHIVERCQSLQNFVYISYELPKKREIADNRSLDDLVKELEKLNLEASSDFL
jgi:hypothetical protein